MLVIVVISFCLMALLPMLASGYYSDDLMNSTLKGQLELRGVSLLTHVLEENRKWIIQSGRFFPVGLFETNSFSYIFGDLLLFKSAILVMVVMNLWLFLMMIRLLVKDLHVACLGALLLPVLFQFRLYHDPILSFSGMMQFLVMLLLVAAIMFEKYLELDRWGYLFVSLVAYNLSLYVYEISFPLALLFPILTIGNIRFGGIRSATRKVAPFFLSLACALAINLLARGMRDPDTVSYTGNSFNPDATNIARTFLVQLLATMPMSYFVFDPARLFDLHWRGMFRISFVLPAIGFGATYWYLISKMTGKIPPVVATKLLLVGTTLLFFPAILISFSAKYQQELRLGLGYIPVYLQYFGLTLLAVWLITRLQSNLRQRWWRALHLTICFVLSFCVLNTSQNNWTVVEKANIDLHYRRAALVKALQEGILAQVPENANLLIVDKYAYDPMPSVMSHLRNWAETGYPWKNAALVYQYAAKRMEVVGNTSDLEKFMSAGSQRGGESSNTYLLEIQSFPPALKKKEGYVVLWKIDRNVVDLTGGIQFNGQIVKTSLP